MHGQEGRFTSGHVNFCTQLKENPIRLQSTDLSDFRIRELPVIVVLVLSKTPEVNIPQHRVCRATRVSHAEPTVQRNSRTHFDRLCDAAFFILPFRAHVIKIGGKNTPRDTVSALITKILPQFVY